MTRPASAGRHGNAAAAGPLPGPPAGLSPRAEQTWLRLAPLVPPGRLTHATADLFAMLCTQIATWQEADLLVQESGLLTVDGMDLAVSPALPIRDHADAMTARWAKMFGLTPDQPAAAPQQRTAAIRHLREA